MERLTKIAVHNRVSDFNSYRAARVKSLFNAEDGCNFDLEAEMDLSGAWQIGVVAGPSGSGKTSIGRVIFGENLIHDYTKGWAPDRPIIDEIAPEGDFNEVTGALSNVGLGDVPAWLRPFRVLSNGEQFRAGLARLICSRPERVVVDEFTSVVDRQIARIGSQAFQKAWRRTNPKGKVVLLTPHYDILDWVQPDWVFDTKSKTFQRGRLQQRPELELQVFKTDARYWQYFRPHHYLDLPSPPVAEFFVGTVDGELACHVAIAPFFQVKSYRAARLVTMPEWQGLGFGIKFLEWVCQYHLEGHGRCGRKLPTLINTSHPRLCAALRNSPHWRQVSAVLYGNNKLRSSASIRKTTRAGHRLNIQSYGYGGHFRAVQGFQYTGSPETGG